MLIVRYRNSPRRHTLMEYKLSTVFVHTNSVNIRMFKNSELIDKSVIDYT